MGSIDEKFLRRKKAFEKTKASLALENLYFDSTTTALINRFVQGEIELEELFRLCNGVFKNTREIVS